MTALWARLEPLLGQVQKPARYIGCEDGAVIPEHGPGKVSWLLAYPDTYEVGLPNQGLQILYEILNERPDAVAERTYAPWRDLAGLLRASGVPLFSVDTHRAAGDFDVLAFNLSSELVFTNVLEMIDLAGVPVRAADRRPSTRSSSSAGTPRSTRSRSPTSSTSSCSARARRSSARSPRSSAPGSAAVAPIATPCCATSPRCPASTCRRCTTSPTTAPAIVAVTPRYPDVPPTVDKRTVADLGEWPYPKHPLVPLTEVVHDRLSVEVFRGCTRGCRFCQAGMITRPVRERPAEQVRTMVADGLRRTGYDEVSLTSLSTADFSDIEGVVGLDPRRPPGRRSRAARRRSTCRRCASTPSPSASPGRSPAGGAAG